MNVTCPNCASMFRVDPSKVPEGGVRARCNICSAVFAVRREGDAQDRPAAVASGSTGARPVTATPATAPSAAAPNIAMPSVPPSPAAVPPPSTPPPAPVMPRAEPVRPAFPAAPGAPAMPAAPARPGSPPSPPPSSPAAPPRPASFPPPAVPMGAPRPATPGGQGAPAAPAARPQGPSTAPPAPAPPPSPPAAAAPAAPPPPVSPPAPRPAPTTGSRPVNPFLSQDPALKARRLARALISDMVVYHPTKRQDGLRDGNLKELFEEEIRKSWEEYADQVGKDVADSTPYFKEALNEILAGGRQIF
jgi:predicted Zn finger-like uncharacterized protein